MKLRPSSRRQFISAAGITTGAALVIRRRSGWAAGSIDPRVAQLTTATIGIDTHNRPGPIKPELRFGFSQLLELFPGPSSKAEVISELFWASLHGIADLSRTKRFPPSRQKERVRALVELFSFPRG